MARRRFPWRLLLPAAVVANGLTLAAVMMTLPYWLDEVATMVFISRPFSELLRYVAADIHPPLYFLLLKGWVTLFGSHPVVTALPSLALHVVAGWLLYRLAWEIFDRRTARLALALFASSFFLIYYATESRMYTLILAAALGSTLETWRLVQRPSDRRARWRYFGWSLVGVYTQYLFWLLLGAQTLTVLLLRARKRTALPLLPLALVQGAVFAAFLPWLPTMVSRLAGKSAQLSWMRKLPLGQQLLTTALDGLVPINPIANIIGVTSWRAWAVLFLLVALALVTGMRLVRGGVGVRLRQEWPTSFLFLAGIIVLPPIFGGQVGAWFSRYFISSVALLLVAYARWLTRPAFAKLRTVLAVGLLAGAAFANWDFWFRVFRHDIAFRWPEVAAAVAAAEQPGEVAFFATAEERLEFRYFYRGRLPVSSFLPRALRRGDPELDRLRVAGLPVATAGNVAEAAVELSPYASVWFIRGPSVMLVDPERLVERWLSDHCQPSQRWVFEGIAGVGAWQEIVAVRYQQCTWGSPLRLPPFSTLSRRGSSTRR